jgi:hypothetical protein
MNITYQDKSKQIPFVSIPVGQTFYDADGELCLKIHTTDLSEYNAVSLSLNHIYEYDDDVLMTPVHCEIIVHGEKP